MNWNLLTILQPVRVKGYKNSLKIRHFGAIAAIAYFFSLIRFLARFAITDFFDIISGNKAGIFIYVFKKRHPQLAFRIKKVWLDELTSRRFRTYRADNLTNAKISASWLIKRYFSFGGIGFL